MEEISREDSKEIITVEAEVISVSEAPQIITDMDSFTIDQIRFIHDRIQSCLRKAEFKKLKKDMDLAFKKFNQMKCNVDAPESERFKEAVRCSNYFCDILNNLAHIYEFTLADLDKKF